MSLDTSLRSAERAGDWRAQVVHLRRAGRYLEAAGLVDAERARLRTLADSLEVAAANERLSGATVRPASSRLVGLRLETQRLAAEVARLQDEHRLASSWQVRCPECGEERATTVDEPACNECARAGQWVRMLPLEQCPPVERTQSAPRRRRKGGR